MRISAWIADDCCGDEHDDDTTFLAEISCLEQTPYNERLLMIALEALNQLGYTIGELQEAE